MAKPTEWTSRGDVRGLCHVIGMTVEEWKTGRRESRFNYCCYTIRDRRTGKPRDLCHPPRGSVLYRVQRALTRHVLAKIDIETEICGYRKGRHNINVAAEISGAEFVGIVDIRKFHPSITVDHVALALSKHGIPWPNADRIARMVTFRGRLPQGAPSSNHIANIVLDSIMRRSILPFARKRRVKIRNFGDDIAFAAPHKIAVEQCVRHAIKAIEDSGFRSNEKCRSSEHRGESRLFIGCATGRNRPDYPRKRFRNLRAELRSILHAYRATHILSPRLSERKITSLKHRIAYVKRLNGRKARVLYDLFFRICSAKKDCDYRAERLSAA